jgi:hypothetical protein
VPGGLAACLISGVIGSGGARWGTGQRPAAQ